MRNLKLALIVIALAVIGFIGFAKYRDGQARVDHGAAEGPLALTGTVVERGRYLAAAADCISLFALAGVNHAVLLMAAKRAFHESTSFPSTWLSIWRNCPQRMPSWSARRSPSGTITTKVIAQTSSATLLAA